MSRYAGTFLLGLPFQRALNQMNFSVAYLFVDFVYGLPDWEYS